MSWRRLQIAQAFEFAERKTNTIFHGQIECIQSFS